MLGPILTKRLLKVISTFELLLVAGGILAVCILLTFIVNRRVFARGTARVSPASAKQQSRGLFEGFDLLFKHRYLGLIALLVLIVNLVNTNGEFILRSLANADAKERVVAQATAAAQAGKPLEFGDKKGDPNDPRAREEAQGKIVGGFYSDLYGWVNLIAMLAQLFVAARLVKYGGVGAGLLLLPLIDVATYGMIAILPVLAYVRWGKIAENATDYSINTSTRKMLFLPTSTEVKYKAQQATESFMQRAGDVVSALVVFTGTELISLSTRGFAIVNVVVVIAWIAIVLAITRDFRRLEAGELPELSGTPAATAR